MAHCACNNVNKHYKTQNRTVIFIRGELGAERERERAELRWGGVSTK